VHYTTRHRDRKFLLTNSALARLRSCERKYYLRDIAGLVSRFKSAAMGTGSAFHIGILEQSPLAAAQCLRGSEEVPWPEGAVDEALEERCLVVEAMVAAALKRWTDWPEKREIPFRLPVFSLKNYPSHNYDMAGVVDGWPSDNPMSHWYDKIGEWKTTGRLSSNYLLGLQTRSQPTAYCYAASVLLGRPIRTVVYRIVQRPTIKRRTKRQPESLEEYANRLSTYYDERPELLFEEQVTRTDHQILEWQAEMFEASKRVHEIRRGDRFPIMNDAACVTFGKCSYLDLCARSVTEEAYDVATDPHPEITAAMNAANAMNGETK